MKPPFSISRSAYDTDSASFLFKILGNDKLNPVPENFWMWPPLCIVIFDKTDSSGTVIKRDFGTGFLINKRKVLSAAHLTSFDYDHAYLGRWDGKTWTVLGELQKKPELSKVPAKYGNYARRFNKSDMLYLSLKDNVPNVVTYPTDYHDILPIRKAKIGEKVVIPGYSIDPDNPVNQIKKAAYHVGHVKSVENDRIYYNVSTIRGFSGAPVISLETTEVVGIHTDSSDGMDGKKGLNSGLAFSDLHISEIKKMGQKS